MKMFVPLVSYEFLVLKRRDVLKSAYFWCVVA